MAGAVQSNCSRADREDKSGLMTLILQYKDQQRGDYSPSSARAQVRSDARRSLRKPEQVHAEDLWRRRKLVLQQGTLDLLRE
jgi:hypothetical protein